MVDVLEYIFFDFVLTPNKSLRFTRFRRSYVNSPAVVLPTAVKVYAAFLLDVRCLKVPFFAAVYPQ